MATIRHQTFLSYHKDDQLAVDAFVRKFDDEHDTFIMRGIRAPEDLIESADTDYVIGQIRKRFLKTSTVTLVLIGKCTSKRRFVDWEIQSSLRRPESGSPNGLLAVLLDPESTRGQLPPRFKSNLDSGYASFHRYPPSPQALAQWIDRAFSRRLSSAHLIENPRDRFTYNRSC